MIAYKDIDTAVGQFEVCIIFTENYFIKNNALLLKCEYIKVVILLTDLSKT